MRGDSFFLFVSEHLYPRWLKMGLEFPIVLVIDGYSAHKNTELFIWCKQHEIILLLLYPNSTHILQVLDIAIFGPLKHKYGEIVEDWKSINPNKNFTELEFIKVLKVTNDAIIKSESIVNGWRASGLQPFNFSNIKLDKLTTKNSNGKKFPLPKEPAASVSIASSRINLIDHDQPPIEPSASDILTTAPTNVIDREQPLQELTASDSFITAPINIVDLENLCTDILFEPLDENQLVNENQVEDVNQRDVASQQFHDQDSNKQATDESQHNEVAEAIGKLNPITLLTALFKVYF